MAYARPAMAAYDTAQWHELFLGVLGAAAALTGLVFVGVSINVERVAQRRGLPERGLEAMALLLGAVLATMAGLVPQPITALGVELIVLGAVEALAVAMLQRVQWRAYEPRYRRNMLVRAPLDQLAVLAFVACGITLLLGAGGGLYWMVPAMALGIVGGVLNAWVLLVEILR